MIQKIFFSYSRVDGSAFALKLALDLKQKGFNVWIDQEDIRAGMEWDLEIEKALETCDCLLYIETEKSVTSNNVLDEVYYALEQHKKVIPLILVDSKTPFRLQRLQHIDFTCNYESGLALLFNELESTTTASTFLSDKKSLTLKAYKPPAARYTSLLIMIVLAVITAAAIYIYTSGNKNKNSVVINQVESPAFGNENSKPSVEGLAVTDIDDTLVPGKTDSRKVVLTSDKKSSGKKSNEALANKTNNDAVVEPISKNNDLTEILAGDWELINVEPKAQTSRGYLKVVMLDEEKVSIKSYVQFYYPKTNETSYLSIFNAFAGCAVCVPEKEMKLLAEDVSVGSRSIKTLKENLADGGKAGDTIMDASSNKSIRATVMVRFIDNNNAVVKIERPTAIELANELIMEPFVYSFRFKKIQ